MQLKPTDILIKSLEHQSILWFKNANSYVLVPPQTAKLIELISRGAQDNFLRNWCEDTLSLSKSKSNDLLSAIYNLILNLNEPKSVIASSLNTYKNNQENAVVKFYKIGNFVVKASFKTEELAFLIHPKFDYLSVAETDFNSEFEVSLQDGNIVLSVDNATVGTWIKNEIEYFQGKFSMCLIEKLYGKPESEWMGVFHASALSYGENSILFMGDSGNGKSTLAALLMTDGWSLLADDFVPILADNQQVYYFPAAISIKESAVKTLSDYYPQLKNTTQHHFKNLNKKVRYLAPTPNHKNQTEHLPCKALVFVKYDTKVDLKCEKIDQAWAFQQLIPDAWLSPEPKNAKQFLNWFTTMPCYQLIYSDTTQMFQTVTKLFNDDL